MLSKKENLLKDSYKQSSAACAIGKSPKNKHSDWFNHGKQNVIMMLMHYDLDLQGRGSRLWCMCSVISMSHKQLAIKR